jgi:inosine-uridine nucleoside N-ribohydrolase
MKKNLNQINVILDTDIGFDPDDLFALLLVLKSSEVKLELVITGNEVGGKRAIFAKKILEQCGYPDIQVVRGEDLGNHFFVVDELIADVQYDIASDYLSAMKDIVGKREKITYIGLNGFTNLANFLRRHPEDLRKLQIFQMGGALNYSRGPDWAEHNVKTDTRATQYVLNSGV